MKSSFIRSIALGSSLVLLPVAAFAESPGAKVNAASHATKEKAPKTHHKKQAVGEKPESDKPNHKH